MKSESKIRQNERENCSHFIYHAFLHSSVNALRPAPTVSVTVLALADLPFPPQIVGFLRPQMEAMMPQKIATTSSFVPRRMSIPMWHLLWPPKMPQKRMHSIEAEVRLNLNNIFKLFNYFPTSILFRPFLRFWLFISAT